MAACQKYGVPPPYLGEECNGYYVHDLHLQYTMVVTGNVVVSNWQTPDGGVAFPDQPISYGALAALVNRPGGDTYLWKMTAKNGMITSIAGVYVP